MQKSVLILKHAPWEGPGLILDALHEWGIRYDIRSIADEAAPQLPDLAELAGVVLMGGPMDADDVAHHPGLARELALVRDAVAADVPVLGICLGHQLIALALGARLQTGAVREIGLAPVEVLGEDRLLSRLHGASVVHWHTDNVGLPQGATLLARTAQCPNQAFRYGSAIGLQFHLELDEALLRTWLDDGGMAAELQGTTAAELLAEFRRDEKVRTAAARHAFELFTLDAAARAATGPAL